MATVYNYTGKDLRLFEINWDTNTIIDSYILASVDDIKIKVKNIVSSANKHLTKILCISSLK